MKHNLELIDFLNWLGVLQSIPQSWKKMLKSCTESLEGEEGSNCRIDFEVKYIPIEQIIPKIISQYKQYVSSKYNPLTASHYFSR